MRYLTSYTSVTTLVSLIACLGIGQFLVSLILAVNLYAGGTSLEPRSQGYAWTGNFLSDLGRTRAWSGADNAASARKFNRAVIVLGASLLPFFAVLAWVLEQSRAAIWLSGTLSACGLIGIGLTPYDQHFVAHHIALGVWIGPMFILVLAYLFAATQRDEASLGTITCTVALLMAVIGYGAAGSHAGYVAMQKVTVVLSIFWFGGITFRVATVTAQQITGRGPLIERQAERYMQQLQRRHRRG